MQLSIVELEVWSNLKMTEIIRDFSIQLSIYSNNLKSGIRY